MITLPQPVLDIECQFCKTQCFVPLTAEAPAYIAIAFIERGPNALATCDEGKALDKVLIGYNIDDILDRVGTYNINNQEKTILKIETTIEEKR